jgi:PEP-CTERM motif
MTSVTPGSGKGRSILISSTFAVALVFTALGIQPARAVPFDYSEDFSLFGQQLNNTCPTMGVCAAITAINSFAFLQNGNAGIYDRNLLPNYNALTKTDPIDATAFATGSWAEPSFPHSDDTPTPDSDIGYYARVAQPGFDPNLTYLATKMDWISDHVPGNSTTFSIALTPTIDQLASDIRMQQDTEFFVKDGATGGTAFYHALTLTRVMCDASGNCSIQYQDPNAPTVQQPLTAVSVVGGRLQFTGVPGSGFAGAVFIDAAFDESPVPEPSSVLLLSAGLIVLIARGWCRRRAA